MGTVQATDLLTAWTASPVGLLLVLVVGGPYLALWWRARRAGRSPSVWHLVLFVVAGLGSLAYAVCGPLAVYRSTLFWVGALQVGVLSSLTPVGLALGNPIRLLDGGAPAAQPWFARALHGRVARVLMFPAVSTLLDVGSLLLVFFTPWFEVSTRSLWLEGLLDVQVLGLGLLFVLPVMVEGLLPAWATPAVRTLLAFADGLFDAVPGILVMTASTLLAPGFPGFVGWTSDPTPAFDQRLGGGALLAVAEAVGVPVIAAVFVQWVAADNREVHAIDAELDQLEIAAGDDGSTHDPGRLAPWWETDPRFAGRYRRP